MKDQAELAKLGFVTRARVTQILNLLNLASDIQQSILEIRPLPAGEDQITERQVRAISEQADWRTQLEKWQRFTARQ